jgi:hypothetical protein
MMKRRSLVSDMDRSVVGSSGNASKDNESLGVNHDQTLEAQTTSFNAGLSSVMSPHRRHVPSKLDVYTRKYIAQWKPDHNM